MSGRAVSRSGSGDRELVMLLVLVALLAGVAGFGWLWGAIGGLLAGEGVPGGLGAGARALALMPGHAADPAGAWKGGAQKLPGPAVMWAIFVLLLVVGTAVAAAVTVVVGQRLRHGRRRRWARWADGDALRELRAQEGEHRNRIALGTYRGKLLAADEEASVLVIAPPRSNKTAGLVIPTLAEWDGPVLATSVRGDLLQTLARRRALGEVKLFDPTGVTGLPSAGWSPISASSTWVGARRTAAMMAQGTGTGGGANADYWQKMSARFLSGLLFAAAQSRCSMRDVMRWVDTFDEEEPKAALEASRAQGAGRALETLAGLWEMDEKPRSSLIQTTANALDPYEDPATLEAEERATITPDWLLEGSNTLFVVAPADDQARLRGLFVALITDVVAAAQRREVGQATAAHADRAKAAHLLLALDECANVAPLPNLDVLASTGGGSGIQLLTVFQSRAQAVERWGAAKADAIMASHRAQLYGTGLADKESLGYLREVLGDEEVETISRSTRGSGSDTSYGTTWRALADGPVAREARTGTAILVYGNLPPARIALRPWFKDRRLTRLVQTVDATAPDAGAGPGARPDTAAATRG